MSLGLIVLLLVSGFAAGMFGAILGLGGGIFVVPILVLAAGVPMHSAIATSLLCVVATSSGAAWKNILRGFANVRLGVTLEIWTVAGAIVGGTLAGHLSGPVLITIFAIAMISIAVPMAHGTGKALPVPDEDDLPDGRLGGSFHDPALGETVQYDPERIPAAMGISSIAGVLSGLLGIGGGILQVPMLVKLCAVPMKAAAATSNFMIGVTGVGSALIYYGRGDVSTLVASATVLGVYGGSRTGAHLAGRLDAALTRKIFSAVMVIIAVQMLLKARGWWPE